MLLLLACAEPAPAPVEPDVMPDPADFVLSGPGGPVASFSPEDLNQPCTGLTGGPEDVEHHNLVGMYDGWLVMPWAPEFGGGGVTLFDFSDPCSPAKVGETYATLMRESHTLGIAKVDGRTILAVDAHTDNDHGGIGFWDLTDPTAPEWLSYLELPDYHYPDAYFRVALSTFWQGDVLFVNAGLLGVFMVDVSDPENPTILSDWTQTAFMAGTFHVIGNVALASSAGLSRTMTLDIGDLDDWQLLADWQTTGDDGEELHPYYFANVGGHYALFARKDEGGGTIVYDIADPANPVRVGSGSAPQGDGGYVFRHHDRLFQGESNYGAIYDFTDPSAPAELVQVDISGDFDTLTPIGNVMVASVDEGADSGMASVVFPWDAEPDARGPTVELHNPSDGESWVPVTGRVGLSFDEQIEPVSVHAGSFRVWRNDGKAVPGRFYGQESIANFVPDEPLDPDTTYVVEIPAGGITDTTGNPTETTLRFTFATGAKVEEAAW